MGIIFRSRNRLYAVISVVFVAVVLTVTIIFWPKNTSADYWSWSAVNPVVFESIPIPDIAHSTCLTSYKKRNVVGESDPKQVCLNSGEDIKYGSYYSSDYRSYLPVVSFSYDSDMYRLKNSPCYQVDSCTYLPDKDILLTKQFLINGLVRSLVVYKNFQSRLQKTLNVKGYIEYNFDSSNPDYTFKNSSDYAWPIGGIVGSDNGKWVAIEFMDRGFGILNTDNFAIKRISTDKLGYDAGNNPRAELAISNDGTHVAVMGMNSGIKIYDVTPTCGDEATDSRMQYVSNIQNKCPTANINPEAFISRFMAGYQPHFNLDGAELSFYAISYMGEAREVSLRAGGYNSEQLDYLALGDSFSSGEGETDDAFYLEGTNDEFEKCHTSTRSYPFLVAASLGIDSSRVKSVACSGASTVDVVGDDVSYWGQTNRLDVDHLGLNDITKTFSQTSAKQSFIPGRIHQISFVNEYKPKVITIGIGGNDAGFMDKLRTCIGTDTCEWAGTAEGREKTAVELQGLFQKLVDTYTDIHDASPNSRIYAIGYPKVMDPNGSCNPLYSNLLDKSERTFMDEGIKYINQVVASAAKAAGIKYVDIESSLGGQVLCGSDKPTMMNGIKLGDDSYISDSMNWLKVIGQESFHPNPLAHKEIADTILSTVPDPLNYNYCLSELSNNHRTCPNQNISPPQPSGYWLADNKTHGYASLQLEDFVSDDPNNINQKSIETPADTFAPGSVVSAEIHSEPITLGQTIADVLGSIRLGIELPASLSEGFHTVHLFGTSPSGQSIDLYQVIKYELPPIDNVIDYTSIDETNNIPVVSLVNKDQEIAQNPVPKDIQPNSVVTQSPANNTNPVSSPEPSVLGASDLEPVQESVVKSNNNYTYIVVILGLLAISYTLYKIIKRKRT